MAIDTLLSEGRDDPTTVGREHQAHRPSGPAAAGDDGDADDGLDE